MRKIEVNKEKFLELFNSGLTCQQIADEMHLKYGLIEKRKREWGLKRSNSFYKKKLFNESFFHCIDCEEKAYWLGFMFSDGYIVDKTGHGIYGQDCFGLNVQEQDKDVLEKFKQALHATNPITWEVRAGRAKMGRLLCTS